MSVETITSSEYIKHHLQNLTYGQLDGQWGFAHTAEQAASMGFWSINVDSMFWSLVTGLVKKQQQAYLQVFKTSLR